jgi:hypothetical protein
MDVPKATSGSKVLMGDCACIWIVVGKDEDFSCDKDPLVANKDTNRNKVLRQRDRTLNFSGNSMPLLLSVRDLKSMRK